MPASGAYEYNRHWPRHWPDSVGSSPPKPIMNYKMRSPDSSSPPRTSTSARQPQVKSSPTLPFTARDSGSTPSTSWNIAPVCCRGRVAVGISGHAGTQFQLGLFPAAHRHLCHAGRCVRCHPGRRRQALCTRFAEATHGSLAADEIRYSRQVTLAWTLIY